MKQEPIYPRWVLDCKELHERARISTILGRFDDALDLHAQSMAVLRKHGGIERHVDEFRAIATGLAWSLMRAGRFLEAWPYWEAGRAYASWEPWPGTRYFDGSGEWPDSLLVQCEGGYGDLMMFMRWLPLLKRNSMCKRLGLMIWKPFEDFCDWSALGVDTVYVVDRDSIPFGEWQASTSIMSLPAVFTLQQWQDIPKREIPEIWPVINSLCSSNDRIGFCWRAEENSSKLRTKSLPVDVASEIAASLHCSGLCDSILSLSPDKTDLYPGVESGYDIPDRIKHCVYEPERMTSWKETARYICSMDFVLTVDTAVAHLCGLLGVPTLVLLPISACWRWGLPSDGPTSHWYSTQLTIYRQQEPLRWKL